ncbi:MAG TPA: YbaB/EbfC family nucleoid-associated protein [Gemmatimonadaceae bacterium]
MPDLSKLLQQAQQMQSRFQQMQEELAARTVTATVGGGMVTVEADGKGQVTRIRIDPSIVSATDVEMLEDLVIAGVREAQKQAADLAQAEMAKMAGGLNIPLPPGL